MVLLPLLLLRLLLIGSSSPISGESNRGSSSAMNGSCSCAGAVGKLGSAPFLSASKAFVPPLPFCLLLLLLRSGSGGGEMSSDDSFQEDAEKGHCGLLVVLLLFED